MRVLVVSKDNKLFDELKNKIDSLGNVSLVAKDTLINEMQKEEVDVVFLLDLKVPVDLLRKAEGVFPKTLFVYNAVTMSPAALKVKKVDTQNTVGMNLLPTFINRPMAEINGNSTKIEVVCLEKLGWQIQWVDNRVGMVTPRVICMIINEAYYTVQEGTASKEDIHIGMKLGTNYPKGPFEWASEIGIKNVYKTLLAVYKDTLESRYKVCPLMKKEVQLG